jgi:hypothetical protein
LMVGLEGNFSSFNKLIAVTYDINIIDLGLKKIFGPGVQIQKLNNLKSEDDLRKDLTGFYRNSKASLYVLDLDYCKDYIHLNLIRYLIEKIEEETVVKDNIKSICILNRMHRNDTERPPLNLFKDWKITFFDSLDGKEFELDCELLELDLKDLIKREDIINIPDIVSGIEENSLQTMKYESQVYSNEETYNYMYSLSKFIVENQEFIHIITEKTLKSIEKNNKHIESWTKAIYTDTRVIADSKSLLDSIKTFVKYHIQKEFTKCLFLFEKRSAFESFLYSYEAQDLDIQRLWVLVFNRLSTVDIAIQNTIQSNIIKFKKGLRLPFIIEEFYCVQEVYREYLALKDTSVQSLTPKEWFSQTYQEKSIWKQDLAVVSSRIDLQILYFKDFINIILDENVCSNEYTDVIYKIFTGMFKLDAFDHNIVQFMDHKDMIVTLNYIFKLCDANFDVEAIVNALKPTFEQISLGFYSNGKGKEANEGFKDEEFKEYQVEDQPLDEDGQESPDQRVREPQKPLETWVVQTGAIIDMIIERMAPTEAILNTFSSIKSYSESLESLENYVNSLSEDIIYNKEKLKFWIQITRIDESRELLLELSSELSDKPESYLTSEPFISSLLYQIECIYTENPLKLLKFKVYFYDKIIEESEEYIKYPIKEINNTDIWKYSVRIIDDIIEISNVIDIIKQVEEKVNRIHVLDDDQNDYIRAIEDLLDEIGTNGRFGVLLSDRIAYKFIENYEQTDNPIEIIQFYIRFINSPITYFPNLSNIIAFARIKNLLDEYCQLLVSEDPEYEEQNQLNEFSNIINDNNLYQLYVYKKIKQDLSLDIVELVKKLKKIDVRWMDKIRVIESKDNLSMFPYVDIDKEYYKTINSKILDLIDNYDVLDRDLSGVHDPKHALLIGLCFLNTVYTQHRVLEFPKERYIEWFASKQALLETKLGKPMATLIRYFTANFSAGSLLHLNINTPDEDYYRSMSICYTLIITFSYNITINPISSIFFNQIGNIHPNLTKKFNDYYIIGSAPQPMHDYLKFTSENFENIKSKTFLTNYSKGGSYKCASDCDYFYFIGNCGGANEVRKCPFCNRDIGGTGHKPIVRPGHENLTDEEAIKYLQEKLNFYSLNEPKGYRISDANLFTTVRLMRSTVSYQFLNFIVSCLLYFFGVSEMVPANDLAICLQSSPQEILEAIANNIRQDYLIMRTWVQFQEPHVWIYSCLSRLPAFLSNNYRVPDQLTARNEFEKLFEESVIMNQSQLEQIMAYKQLISDFKKPPIIINEIEEISEPPYPYYEFFRITEAPTYKSMAQAFSMYEKKHQLILLKIFIENQSELKNLKYFYPIIRFSNYLLEKFSFTISRSEAMNTPIRNYINEDRHLSELLQSFLKSWKKLKIGLQFDCHILEKPNFDEGYPLSYFLVDNFASGHGVYITSALKELSKIQNHMIRLCIKDIEKIQKDYPIQSLTEKDIITFSISKTDLTRQCSINCPEYSKGKHIFYDFERIQLNITKDLRNKKILNTETLNYMNFQFELLNTRGKYSGIISGIRNNILQAPLDSDGNISIKKYFEIIDKKTPNETRGYFKSLYGLMEKMLCFLRNSHENSEVEIKKILKLMSDKIKFNRSEEAIINQIPKIQLKYLIEVYERIEMKCYPIMINYVGQEYRIGIEDQAQASHSISMMINEISSRFDIEYVNQLNYAVKRIIIRLLCANIEPSFKIKDYIENRDYWSLSYIDRVDEIVSSFPATYELKHAVAFDDLFTAELSHLKSSKKPEPKQKLFQDKKEERKSVRNSVKLKSKNKADV